MEDIIRRIKQEIKSLLPRELPSCVPYDGCWPAESKEDTRNKGFLDQTELDLILTVAVKIPCCDRKDTLS